MFSFFKRKSHTNNKNGNKSSINLEETYEKQKSSPQQSQQSHEQKKQNIAADQVQRNSNFSVIRPSKNEDNSFKNRTTALPISVDEYLNSKFPTQNTDAKIRQQNYDQFRDSRRTSYMFNYSPERTNKPNSHCKQNTNILVASSKNDQGICFPLIDVDSNDVNNTTDDVMGRRRSRTKNRSHNSSLQNQIESIKCSNFDEDKKKLIKHDSENFKIKQNVKEKHELVSDACNQSALSEDNLENSARFYNEQKKNFHGENFLSKNNSQENQKEEVDTCESCEEIENNSVKSSNYEDKVRVKLIENLMKNEESLTHQMLSHKDSLSKRSTLPSTNYVISSDEEEEEEEETISEDIFYEAEPSFDLIHKLSSENNSKFSNPAIAKQTSEEIDPSNSKFCYSAASSFDGTCKNKNTDDIVMNITSSPTVLTLDENTQRDKLKYNEMIDDDVNTFINNDDDFEASLNYDYNKNLQRVKASSILTGEDTFALPDIVAETSLCEQPQLHADDTASMGSETSKNDEKSSESSYDEFTDKMQPKIYQLSVRIDDLERQLEIKNGAVERLQFELEATNKESECVRQRLRYQDENLEKVKERQDLLLDEEQRKYELLENQNKETVEELHKMQALASSLNLQLVHASSEVVQIRQERNNVLDDLASERKLLQDTLLTATEQIEQTIAKWKHEFEELRNRNWKSEEHIIEDCEWKLRQMMKQYKEKMEKIENEKEGLRGKIKIDEETIKCQCDEIRNLKAYEREAAHLRSLSEEQKSSLSSMFRRVDDLKSELLNVKRRLQDEIDSCLQIKRDCAYQLSEKERSCLSRVEIARGEIAMEWEDRLMGEMCRLTRELEQVHLDERNSALNKLKAEQLLEIQTMTNNFKQKEQDLLNEISLLKAEVDIKLKELQDIQSKADMQLLEHRSYLQKQDRDHQKDLDNLHREIEEKEAIHINLVDEMNDEHKREKEQIKASFYRSLEQIKNEFAHEIKLTTESLQEKHKKEIEEQWKQLNQEKEAALLHAENCHRVKMEDADNILSALKLTHKRELSDIKDQFEFEKLRLNSRDVSNTQEIDTLHRKCICLTKLFEEMRMRYERRDPRAEDLRQIDELKVLVESQENDIFHLTEKLRELQLQYQSQNILMNPQNGNSSRRNKNKGNKSNNCNSNLSHAGNSNNLIDNNRQSNEDQHEQGSYKAQQNPQQVHKQKKIHLNPPSLIETVIFEEENENELYEQQILEERENIQKLNEMNDDEAREDGHDESTTVVEIVPESPKEYSTDVNRMNLEEISEAHIISNLNQISDVLILPATTLEEKFQEIRVEVISTIEPSNIQLVSLNNGNVNSSSFEDDLE